MKEASTKILKALTQKYEKFKEMWQIGFTKAFLKEETRAGLERLLGEAILKHVVRIQSVIRMHLAKARSHRRRTSMLVINKNVFKYLLRKKFR